MAPHECDGRRCVIVSLGDLHLCALTGAVHCCRDVSVCEFRFTDPERDYIVCRVSGLAKRSDELTPFGSLVTYASGAAPSRARRQRDEGPAEAARARLYRQKRACTALEGDPVVTRLSRRARQAIVDGDAGGVDDGGADDDEFAADAAATREARSAHERSAAVQWLADQLVRRDVARAAMRRATTCDLRWRKVVNEYVGACMRTRAPIRVPMLAAFVQKKIAQYVRWRRAYESIPRAWIDAVRDWVVERIHLLWRFFRPRVQPRRQSPLRYNASYHALAVMYCSASGIVNPGATEGPPRAPDDDNGDDRGVVGDDAAADRARVLTAACDGSDTWLLAPIPYLDLLLPSQKELDKFVLAASSRARIAKALFTATLKVTRDMLVRMTDAERAEVGAQNAAFVARLRPP